MFDESTRRLQATATGHEHGAFHNSPMGPPFRFPSPSREPAYRPRCEPACRDRGVPRGLPHCLLRIADLSRPKFVDVRCSPISASDDAPTWCDGSSSRASCEVLASRAPSSVRSRKSPLYLPSGATEMLGTARSCARSRRLTIIR